MGLAGRLTAVIPDSDLSKGWQQRLFTISLIGFLVAWPLFVSWSVLTHGPGMFYQDSFNYLETLTAWQAGGSMPSGLWLSELFEPQNDSRLFVGRILLMLWWIIDGRNTDSYLVYNLLGAALGALLCATLTKKARPDLPREFHLAVAAGFVLLFFSFGHRQNWPFHIQAGHFFMPVFLALAWHVNFTKWSLPTKAAINCLLAILGMFSYAGGLAIWLLCFPWPARSTGHDRPDFPDRRPTRQEILAWVGYAVVAAICVSIYVLNMRIIGVTEAGLKSEISLATRAAYVAVWVGTAWNYSDWISAFWTGVATLIILCMAGLYVVIHGPARRNPGAWAFLSFSAFGVLMGAMASMGRAHEGIAQAMSHRYFTMQSSILIGLLGLAVVLAPNRIKLHTLAKSPLTVFAVGLLAAWLMFQQTSYYKYFIEHTNELRQGTQIVKARNFISHHPAAQIVLFMDLEKLRNHLPPMIALGLIPEYPAPQFSQDAYQKRLGKSGLPENTVGHWDSCSAAPSTDPARPPELQVSGWAASTPGRPADLILFTYQDPDGKARPFHIMTPNFMRPDVAEIVHPGLLHSGFRATIPMSLLPQGQSHHIAAWSYNSEDGSVAPLANSFQVDIPVFSVQPLP
jgi:hypothetical protein